MMHDLAAQLTSEIAAARAAIWSSYSRLWGEHERLTPGVDAAGHRGQAGLKWDARDERGDGLDASSADR
jgi:hypothetical protein